MSEAAPRIVGLGRHVPATVRYNADPIFDWLHGNAVVGKDLFQGFLARRVLGPGEDLADLMVPAAEQALADAGLAVSDVDLLLGCGSIGARATPNALSEVHHRLGLGAHVWPIPLMNDFSQAPAAIWMADALIRAGRGTTALLVFGDDWSRHVNYRTPQSISAADGAAALVMRASMDTARWTLVDQLCNTDTRYCGAMVMAPGVIAGQGAPTGEGLVDDRAFTQPYFQINDLGIEGFTDFGKERAPNAVLDLLARHGVDPAETCLISHQASAVLMDYWEARIGPGHVVNTLEDVANLVLCSVPFNLAHGTQSGEITQDWLVMLCLGPDMHANAMLMRRG